MCNQKFLRSRARARGLTLVELLLVVSLVAVLASLAASAWGGYQDRIRTKQAVDDITGLSALLDQTFTDTGELPDSLADIGRGGMADPWGNPYQYTNLTTANGPGRRETAWPSPSPPAPSPRRARWRRPSRRRWC